MRLFLLLVFIAVSVFIGLGIAKDPGYMFISYQNWTVETPLWLGIVVFFLGIYFIYLFLRLLIALVHSPSATKDWLRNKQLRRVRRRTIRGYIAFAEGNWKEAEKLLIKSSDKQHTAVINYLCAAASAQKLGKIAMRDEYLRLAHESDNRADMAIGITQARLQLESGQLEQGLATLKRLHRIAPHHDYILELLEQVLVQLKDWEGLLEIMPALKTRELLPASTLERLSQQAYVGLLQQCHTDADKKFVWQRIPAQWRMDPDVLVLFLPVLINDGDMIAAETLVKHALKKSWDVRLVRFYGRIHISDLDRQIKTAESWQKRHPEDPTLLLCLGRLYAVKAIWGQAKNFLEMSLSIQPDPETHYVLGQVYHNLGETALAEQHYQQGLALSLKN